MRTRVRGFTNRQMSSTWPCVSSPAIPRPSQNTLVTPSQSPHGRLEALAPQAGVADLLPGGEIALLGREQRAPAVDLDAPAFEDEVPAPDARREEALREQPRRRLRDASVPGEVGVLGPGVEVEVHDRRLGAPAGASPDEDRPAVARPTPVGGVADEPDARERGAGPGQALPGEPFLDSRSRPGCAPPRPGRACARSRRRPSGSCRACGASRWGGGASPARSPRGAPTPPAWRSPAPRAWDRSSRALSP